MNETNPEMKMTSFYKKFIEWFNELEQFGKSNEYVAFMQSKSFNRVYYNVIHVIRETENRYKVLILFTKKLWNMYMDKNGIILYIEELLNVSVLTTPPNHCNKYVTKQFGFTCSCYVANEMYISYVDDNRVVVKRYNLIGSFASATYFFCKFSFASFCIFSFASYLNMYIFLIFTGQILIKTCNFICNNTI